MYFQENSTAYNNVLKKLILVYAKNTVKNIMLSLSIGSRYICKKLRYLLEIYKHWVDNSSTYLRSTIFYLGLT